MDRSLTQKFNMKFVCLRCKKEFNNCLWKHCKGCCPETLRADCGLCKRRFLNQKAYSYHLKTHHNIQKHPTTPVDDANPFICKKSDKRFGTKQRLQVHDSLHLIELQKRFGLFCEICKKGFQLSHQLVAHQRKYSSAQHF